MSDTPRTDDLRLRINNTDWLKEAATTECALVEYEKFERENQQLKAERDTAHQSVHKWSNKSVELAEQVVALKAELKVCAEALIHADKALSWDNTLPAFETYKAAFSQPITQSLLQKKETQT